MSPKRFVTLAVALAATALLDVPSAMGGTGDLDPSFADLGRLTGIAGTEARSVVLTDAGGLVVGSNALSVTSYEGRCTTTAISYVSLFGSDGATDPSFTPARVDGIHALSFGRQADGRIVGVGRRVVSGVGRCFLLRRLVAFRLNPDGSFDTGFGSGGTFDLDSGEIGGGHEGHSQLLEASGKVVVAGQVTDGVSGKEHLLVLRLRGDGRLDPRFGRSGIHVGPEVNDFNFHATSIARTPSGGYRIASTGPDGCFVTGLTIDGQPDTNFGIDGIAPIAGRQGEMVTCNDVESTAEGGLLIAGIARTHGFAAQLRANGAMDPAFVADPVIARSLTTATAIASGSNGTVYVAGVGPKGTSILRLNAAGALDAPFGDDGRTWLDMRTLRLQKRPVHDMALQADGSLFVAGAGPFVARLLGDAGGESAGVVSVLPHDVSAREADGLAIVRVRRSGGGDGSVSVDYRTVADGNAVVDRDFTAKQGTLHWADGDRSNRAIVAQISQDAGIAEKPEDFHVLLENFQGHAGLGRLAAKVTIAPDGEPGGQIQFTPQSHHTIHPSVPESRDFVELWLSRDFYAVGRVCVDVATRSGTAIAGKDFTATQSVQCWRDRDIGYRLVMIPVLDDNRTEQEEHFTVVLSNATGGAVIGAGRTAKVTIRAND